MTVRIASRAIAAIGAGVLTAALLAPPSQARADVTTEEVSWSFFYDDIVTGDGSNTLILQTGARVEQTCTEEPTTTLRIRTKGVPPADGAMTVESFVTRGEFYVYEGNGLDGVEFYDLVCSTIEAGGEAPEPVATGSGLVKAKTETLYNGESAPPDVSTANSAVGVVWTAEGERWVVRGEAELTLSPSFNVDHVSFEILNQR